jgi:hypothetical protein
VKLLEIQSSPRGDSSDSIALTTSFIEACKSANASIVVDCIIDPDDRWGGGAGTVRERLGLSTPYMGT